MGSKISKKNIYINKLSSTSSLKFPNKSFFFVKIKKFLLETKKNYEEKYLIKVNTLDNIFKNYDLTCSLLKIDVEGSEFDVLKGGQIKIQNQIQFVLVEKQFFRQYKESSNKKVHNFLIQKKFKLYKKFTHPGLHFQDNLYVKK